MSGKARHGVDQDEQDDAPASVVRDPYDVTWRERVVVLGSLGGVLLCAFIAGLLHNREATMELVGLVPASIVAIGKFLPLWGIGSRHYSPWELGLVIWCLDTSTVLIVVYGLKGIYSIGPLRRGLVKVQSNAGLVLRAYPRIRRAAVAGVFLFVLFPLAGTGAFVGSFLGILLGLHRAVLIAAVSAGGLAGGMLMAFAAVNFRDVMIRIREAQSDPTIKWIIIGLVGAILVVAFWWLNRAYKRALEAARDQLPGDGAA